MRRYRPLTCSGWSRSVFVPSPSWPWSFRPQHQSSSSWREIKALTRELKDMVVATGSTLMELPGVGPVVAARTLADTGDVARFTDRNRFASWTGTPPSKRPPERSCATGSPARGTGG